MSSDDIGVGGRIDWWLWKRLVFERLGNGGESGEEAEEAGKVGRLDGVMMSRFEKVAWDLYTERNAPRRRQHL